MASHRWYHLGLQSYLPNVLGEQGWSIDHRDAYFGGSCIEVKTEAKGHLKYEFNSDSEGEGNVCIGSSLFKCFVSMDSTCDVTFVFKADVDVLLELRWDNAGSAIRLEKTKEDRLVRGWQVK